METLEIENDNVQISKLGKDHPLYLDPVHMKLFLSYIRVDGLDENACWVWTGAVDKGEGYGKFRIGKKVYWSHRIAQYNREGVPTGKGDRVRHRCPCKNRLCMRHLKFGTARDNWVDSILDGTIARMPKDVSAIFYSDESENEKLDSIWKSYESKKDA